MRLLLPFRSSLPPLALALALAAPAPAGAITEAFRLTGLATISAEGAASSAPLTGTFELVRGPFCFVLPTGATQCTEPPQWTPGSFDLEGGGLEIRSGTIDPITILELSFRGEILLDPVDGLDRIPILLERELLVDNATGQVFRDLRLAPVAGPEVFDFGLPGGSPFHPNSLTLAYELQERFGTITFPRPGEVGLPELTGETITPLAAITLAATLPEPSAALLLAGTGVGLFVRGRARGR